MDKQKADEFRGEKETIEREAMHDELGWFDWFSKLPKSDKESTLRPLLDATTLDRWKLLVEILSNEAHT